MSHSVLLGSNDLLSCSFAGKGRADLVCRRETAGFNFGFQAASHVISPHCRQCGRVSFRSIPTIPSKISGRPLSPPCSKGTTWPAGHFWTLAPAKSTSHPRSEPEHNLSYTRDLFAPQISTSRHNLSLICPLTNGQKDSQGSGILFLNVLVLFSY